MTNTTRCLMMLALLTGLTAGAHGDDTAKRAAEIGPERVLERARDDAGALPDNASRVAPGRVRWHADEAAARRAALESGKPVLVFQLLGRLDEEFC